MPYIFRSHSTLGTASDGSTPGIGGGQYDTSTSDAIMGPYYNNAINQNWGYSALVMYQTPLYSTDNYRPGNILNGSLGLRYVGFDMFVPQLQLNVRDLQRDTGANADTVSTGGTLLYISPGIVAAVSDRISIYAFVQVPV